MTRKGIFIVRLHSICQAKSLVGQPCCCQDNEALLATSTYIHHQIDTAEYVHDYEIDADAVTFAAWCILEGIQEKRLA